MQRTIHISSSLLLTHRSLRITYSTGLLLWHSSCAVCTSVCPYSACTPHKMVRSLFSIHNVVKMSKSQIFSCIFLWTTSVIQVSTNRIVCLMSAIVFVPLRWPDGQMTDHVTLFHYKQLIQFDLMLCQ